LKKIGATSLLKVTTGAVDFVSIAWLAGSASKMAAPRPTSAIKTTRDFFMASTSS
jgi:hypothetical protein